MENRNKFESKGSLIWWFIFSFILALLGLWIIISLSLMDADRAIKYIEHYVYTGKGASRGPSALVGIFYSTFGRTGCILFLFFCDFIVFLGTFSALNKLRRYLRKEKLFKLGLVSDMDDDHKPVGVFRFLKGLFRKPKTDRPKVKTYSRRELREMKKKLQELERSEKKNEIF